MNDQMAAMLLASLLERVEGGQAIGVISSLERQALKLAVEALAGVPGQAVAAEPIPARPAAVAVVTTPVAAWIAPSTVPLQTAEGHAAVAAAAPPVLPATLAADLEEIVVIPDRPHVKLVLASLDAESQTPSDVLMCLDFGTAMSKAFASVFPNNQLDLALGTAAGHTGYALPSSVFIADDSKAYFGFDAIEMSQGLEHSGRERLDSIKGWISLQNTGSLDEDDKVLSPALNPSGEKLTQGDLLRIYLAYFTDIALCALQLHVGEARHVKRRYARPCWPDSKAQWGSNLMRRMLSEAQVLADTFSGRWQGGIPVAELKVAVEQVKKLDRRPDFLIDEGVPEPVAVAAGAIADSENLRDAFMVVDVGAGTTDFGLFISTRKPDDDTPRVFQSNRSIQGLMQAGDKVDGLLRGFIAKKESIDSSDNSGRLILADLSRRIRSLKEVFFKTGELEYTLSDDTVGRIKLNEFLADERVVRFGQAVEEGFKKALSAVDESWLRWLAMDGVRLHVVVTGGSSTLPMMQALSRGLIEVNGHRILRKSVDPKPHWMRDMPPELLAVYPQLAVAIGGAAEMMPETKDAPISFGGGPRTAYVLENIHVG